jgi:hypothetical protein
MQGRPRRSRARRASFSLRSPSGAALLSALALTALALAACDGSSAAGSGAGAASAGGAASGGGGQGQGGEGASSSGGAGGEGAAGGAAPGTLGMFVAQGHLGRTLVSCDGGHTWLGDQSLEPEGVCWPDQGPGIECDHHPGAAGGLAFEGGAFFATFGWGDPPGGVVRSTDGVSWVTVLDGTTFGGLAAGQGRVVAADRYPQWTSDGGATWTEITDAPLTIWNLREIGFADVGGGVFVMVGSDGATEELVRSTDGGVTWTTPDTLDPACELGFYAAGGITAGNGVILIANGSASVCRSTDAGLTWQAAPLPSAFESSLVFTGSTFSVWAAGQRLDSPDGLTWTATPLTPAGLVLGPVATSDQGAFVSVRGGWGAWYEEQRFYRSDDGVAWTELDVAAAPPGHPLRDLEFGRVTSPTTGPCAGLADR